MAETFYPFVEGSDGAEGSPELAPPTSAARIAVYDTMTMAPRVEVIKPSDIRSYLDEITKTVFDLATQQGGDWSFMVIRELVENFIHASFIEPSISILDKGQTLVFSDQGPGIPNKSAALKPSFSSADKAMKRYIRGVGSGLPIVEEQLRLRNGTLTIEDNLGHGTIVTVSLLPNRGATDTAAPSPSTTPYPNPAPQTPPQQPQGAPYGYGGGASWGFQQGAPGNPYGMPAQQVNPYDPSRQPYPGMPPAYGQPAMNQQAMAAQPYPQPYPAPVEQGYYGNPYGQQPAYYGNPQALPTPGGYMPPAAGYGMQQPQGSGQPYGAVPGYGGQQPYGEQAQPAEPYATVSHTPQDPQRAMETHVPLDERQRSVLRLFARMEQVGGTVLQENLNLSQATASRCLGTLAKAGYICKNGQKYILTGEGERMLALLMKSEG